jgi:hypothetical protein
LARGALTDHHLEAAVSAATTTVRLAVAVRSSRSTEAVANLRERLRPHDDSPEVLSFFELADTLVPTAS